MLQTWHPSVGAWPKPSGVQFRVWCPDASEVLLILDGVAPPGDSLAMAKDHDGIFELLVADAKPGTRYSYRIDGKGPFPDPASRFQPDGVHGPSEVIDPCNFVWGDQDWKGIEPDRLVDLRVARRHASRRQGTFAAAAAMLPKLADLGVTAVELMPLADFPGDRGWGYDGV